METLFSLTAEVGAYHTGQSEECGLDLSHVSIFKEVVCFKDVIGLQAIVQNSFDEVSQVFQLGDAQKAYFMGKRS